MGHPGSNHRSKSLNELRATIGIPGEVHRIDSGPNLGCPNARRFCDGQRQKQYVPAGQEGGGHRSTHLFQPAVKWKWSIRLVPPDSQQPPFNTKPCALALRELELHTMPLPVVYANTDGHEALFNRQEQADRGVEAPAVQHHDA